MRSEIVRKEGAGPATKWVVRWDKPLCESAWNVHSLTREDNNEADEKVINVQPGFFWLVSNKNTSKTILELNVQGENSMKSMLFYPGPAVWYCRTKPMLKYEYNCYLNMVFVRQNRGRTISIPTLDAQFFSTIPTISGWLLRDLLHSRWIFVKNQPKNPGWMFITFHCASNDESSDSDEAPVVVEHVTPA